MNFDFSDDLKQLREQARKFLRERCPSTAVRRVLEGPEPYDKALWKEIAAMGWTGAAEDLAVVSVARDWAES